MSRRRNTREQQFVSEQNGLVFFVFFYASLNRIYLTDFVVKTNTEISYVQICDNLIKTKTQRTHA